ncbi:MAG TPA: PAS domain S-box protein [Bryobacteraceae bacterium]|nr:PAS domain S-box protein [Bryobacteraceae bacterium]
MKSSTELPLELLANFTDALVVLDQNWCIEYANPRAARIYRKTPDQLLGATPWEQWPESQRSEIEEQHRRALKEQTPVELQNPHADSAEKWIELRAFSSDLGIVVYYHDLTEQKRATELRERLAAIVESSDDAIISKSLSGIIQTWNRGAERIFGYKSEEIIGKHISTLAAPETVDEIPDILQRIARGERVDHYQTKRKTKDGRILTVSLTVSPIRDAAGVVIGASKVARDITERERQEEALRTVNAALTRSNADLQQFAYSASHDLQEPLRAVATYSEMLKRKFGGQLGAIGDEYIDYTIQGALRMERLLHDLRAYTQASTLEDRPSEDVDAGRVLNKALENLVTTIKDSGAAIDHTALPRVRMHAVQLQQLFQNLIGNSIRYRSNDPPRIQVSAKRQGNEWLFSVQDNGIGIEPQYKEQVFGIFKRLHSTAEYPGTGMGLAICQRIVERAGGRIWVESQLGQGATFYFTVPCGQS